MGVSEAELVYSNRERIGALEAEVAEIKAGIERIELTLIEGRVLIERWIEAP